ncbi:MAG: hypothetical protein WBW73_00650, partial [Rhodoplanes sp.]
MAAYLVKRGRPIRQFPCAFVSRQFGLASAPTIPQAVQIMRGRKELTSTASDQRSAGNVTSGGRSGRPSGLKGTKVPAKYRGPDGE